MSKAPKTKKTALHYQPYQTPNNSESDDASMDLNISDIPLHLDPVLSGLSSNMSRNLWDDWNENDANFGMKLDMHMDEANAVDAAAAAATSAMYVDTSGTAITDYEQQPNGMMTDHKPRANVERSLSEDIVNMLDETNETTQNTTQNMLFHASHNVLGLQQQSNLMAHFQQQQMHMHMQQKIQQQQYQQHLQQAAALHTSRWMNNFNGNIQSNASTRTPASGKPSNPSVNREPSPPNSSTLDFTMAEETAAQCPVSQAPATFSSLGSTTAQHASNLTNASENLGVASTQANTFSARGAPSDNGTSASKTLHADTNLTKHKNDVNMNNPAQQVPAFNTQGMMMNPFMMNPFMMGPQGMNMMGIPMQMPMGMPNTNGMHGMSLAMQMQMQLQLQMQMAQIAQMSGMGGMSGMQMPMGLAGIPMAMNMQMPFNLNMQQQQQQQEQEVNPQSGQSGDVKMAPAFSMGVPAASGSTPKSVRALQPKGVRGGSGFVNIARKPEEPGVSSILKSLMEEEAKKKEKKLERNRDSARESRKKQQTYVETLENGIKCLQINRDVIRSYRWGISGPGPCPNALQMLEWRNLVEVVTGRTEAFLNIQNPANFQSLMRLNRQRRTLAMDHQERERAVWKSFVFMGRQLAVMRTRVLQMQALRMFTENPLTMELDTMLNLSPDQRLQLQCLAQQMLNEEVVELTKLFKIFFALRNEALRLNLLSPSLECHFREVCSFDQLQKLLQWTENYRSVIETDLCLDEV